MAIEIHPYLYKTGLTNQLNFDDQEISNRRFKRGGIWFEDSEVIICGTFPPFQQYNLRKGYIHYSSSKNQFWKHIDSIFNTKLFIPNAISKIEERRIANALSKIGFIESKKIGFIDVFTKIERKIISSKDSDIISIETIFDNGIIDDVMQSKVQKVIFVYSLSRDVFISQLQQIYRIVPTIINAYGEDKMILEVQQAIVKGKKLLLIYSPIHGPNTWVKKQEALKKAIEMKV